MKGALLLLVATLLASCAPSAQRSPTPSVSPQPSPIARPSQQLGPGGLTLDQEVGAVMMVGVQGPPSDSVVADWRQRQFGGLLVVNLNHNASTPESMKSLIAGLRGASNHRLIAATDQEGGAVCLAISSVPCPPEAGRPGRHDPHGERAQGAGL